VTDLRKKEKVIFLRTPPGETAKRNINGSRIGGNCMRRGEMTTTRKVSLNSHRKGWNYA